MFAPVAKILFTAYGRGMAKRDPVSKYLAMIGSIGGSKKVPKGAAMLSPAERTALAKAGALVRWGKPKAKKTALTKTKRPAKKTQGVI